MRLLYLFIVISLFKGVYAQNSIDANIPDKLAAYSTHTIEITIKKGPISSFSKYQLDVPVNVSIREGKSLDGHFTFENRRAKLVWVESPKTDEFTVSFILSVGNASGQATFEHRYYYIDGETKKEISDGPMYVEFTPGNPSAKQEETPVKIETLATPTPTTPPVTQTPTTVTKTEEPKKVTITIPVSTPTTAPVTNTTPSTTQPNSSNTTPVSIPEIKEYKVQIGSMGAKPNLNKYSNVGKITVIEENGLYKVLAGSYKTKEEAVKKMEELKTQGYPGFVVCFVNGVKVK